MPVVTRAMVSGTAQRLSVRKSLERKRNDKNDNPWLERNDHPLTNDVVLRLLFEYVEEKDLTACRLVGRKWNILTIPFVRSNFLITISGTKDARNLPKKGIKNFVKLMSTNTLGIPFERFKMGSFDTTKGAGQQFLKICGENAIEIILDDIDVHLIEDISEMLRCTPNLRYLTLPTVMTSRDGKSKVVKLFPEEEKPKLPLLRSVDFPSASGRNSTRAEIMKICPTFYEELFEAAENMSTLDLAFFSSELSLKILETLGKLGRESSVKHLVFKHTPDEPSTLEVFNSLQQMSTNGMELQGLFLLFTTHEPHIADWFQLVTYFRNSLTSLNLGPLLDDPTTLINFPRMPKLKELDICMANNLSQNCDDFHHIFPSLQKLNMSMLTRDDIEFNFLIGSEGRPCPNMKSLILPENPIKMENLNRILTNFPSLKVLDCKIIHEEGGDVLKGIWSHLTQLEDMKISGTLKSSENIDSLVAGIPVHVIKSKDMKEFLCSLQEQSMEDRKEQILLEANKYSTLPSIKNLTNLRTLKLNLTTKKSRGRRVKSLSDIAAYLGLYSLENLRHINMRYCVISRNCADTLVKDMGLHTWTFVSKYKIRGRNHSFKFKSK